MIAVRDFLLISIIVGVMIGGLFIGVFNNAQVRGDYSVDEKHTGEKSYESMFTAIQGSAAETETRVHNMSTDLQAENTVGYLTAGATTISIIKSALTFQFLGAMQNTTTQIAREFSIPPFLVNSAIAMIICIAIFTVISAFMRWRT